MPYKLAIYVGLAFGLLLTAWAALGDNGRAAVLSLFH